MFLRLFLCHCDCRGVSTCLYLCPCVCLCSFLSLCDCPCDSASVLAPCFCSFVSVLIPVTSLFVTVSLRQSLCQCVCHCSSAFVPESLCLSLSPSLYISACVSVSPSHASLFPLHDPWVRLSSETNSLLLIRGSKMSAVAFTAHALRRWTNERLDSCLLRVICREDITARGTDLNFSHG